MQHVTPPRIAVRELQVDPTCITSVTFIGKAPPVRLEWGPCSNPEYPARALVFVNDRETGMIAWEQCDGFPHGFIAENWHRPNYDRVITHDLLGAIVFAAFGGIIGQQGDDVLAPLGLSLHRA